MTGRPSLHLPTFAASFLYNLAALHRLTMGTLLFGQPIPAGRILLYAVVRSENVAVVQAQFRLSSFFSRQQSPAPGHQSKDTWSPPVMCRAEANLATQLLKKLGLRKQLTG